METKARVKKGKNGTTARLEHELEQAALANRRLAEVLIKNMSDCEGCPCWDIRVCEYSRRGVHSRLSSFPRFENCVESVLIWARGGWQNRRSR